MPAMRVCDSYGGFLGESETWHNLVDRGLVGERVSDDWPIYKNGGLLMFHMEGIEAQERCFRGTQEEADIYYADQRTMLRDGAYLRLHENKRATGEEMFIPLADWDACIDETHRPIMPPFEYHLFVGVDAATKHDAAAVVAVFYDQEQGNVVLAKHRIWYPSPSDPLDLDGTIGDYLRDMYYRYPIIEIRCDPYQLHDLITRLQAEGFPIYEFAQSSPNLTAIGQNLFEIIRNRNLVLYPDLEMRLAASHAIAVQSSRGWRIAKEKTSHKIDVIVALAMASLAAVEKGVARWLIY
jgi:phage terminase large subunit-like protein